MATNKRPLFKDISLSFAPNPFTGDVSVTTNENAIIQSLKNILLTDKFEVPFDSSFGGSIRALLFEQPSPAVASEIKQRIEFAIENFEPRIELIGVSVNSSEDGDTYTVNVVFIAVTSITPTSATFSLRRVL